MTIDPRAPCVIGVAQQTWRPDGTGSGALDADGLAPEPLEMWHAVARAAAADAAAARGVDAVLAALNSIQIVYCQSWSYDDPVARLADQLRGGATRASGPMVEPQHGVYSGIGGTTPQVLVDDIATAMLRGELDVALVVGAEALATRRRLKKAGERPVWSYPDPQRRPFPFEAPFHAAEIAHDVFQAWLTFAVFDIARRGHLAIDPTRHRAASAALLASMTEAASKNPHAWFPERRTAEELATATPTNRLVGYPYTKQEISIMDVDEAAALVVATHEAADKLGVPSDQRVYLRGWGYACDPVYVAEHDPMWASPAMTAAVSSALAMTGDTAAVGSDEITHFDLYSCFASSLAFALDALDMQPDDPRGVTVTGGLPFAGGPGSNYVTHSIATMVDVLRRDPGALGLVSGVGMHLTKHVFAVYGTEPPSSSLNPGDSVAVQQSVERRNPPRRICHPAAGAARIDAYSVVHGSDGSPQWAIAIATLADGERCYARSDDPALLAGMEAEEWVGRSVDVIPGAAETDPNLLHI